MPTGIMQERKARLNEAAAMLGATVVDNGEMNEWGVAVVGRHVGDIRYEPRAIKYGWLRTERSQQLAIWRDVCDS